jgi:3-phenylpropionate/cinnamic acid dioxygenase small subunit
LAGAAVLAAAITESAPAGAQTSSRISTDDYVQIQQLYARYCHALDKGNGDDFANCFTDDGEFTGGRGPGRANDDRTPRKGRPALTVMGNTSGTRHFNANLVLNPVGDGNTVKGSVYLMLYSARTTPPSFQETAIYDDTIVRTGEGWRFKKRVVWRDDDDITPFKPKPLPANRQTRQ